MKSVVKRIRKEYAPLTINCNLVCISPANPVAQAYDAVSGEYQPDRTVSPTVILPDVTVNAPDGSWLQTDGNPILAQMQWYVNGAPIEDYTPWTEGREYEISTDADSNRGALRIGGLSGCTDTVNLQPDTRLVLSFSAVIADTRLGINVPVLSDEIILSTIEKTEDGYSVSVGTGPDRLYNPFKDMLLQYDNSVSIGEITPSQSAYDDANDQNSYLKAIPVYVFRANNPILSGYTLKVYRIENGAPVELEEGDDELLSVSLDEIVFDMRLVESDTYEVRIYSSTSGNLVAQTSFTLAREYPAYRVNIENGIDLNPDDRVYLSPLQVSSEAKDIIHPEVVIDIEWFTDTTARQNVSHCVGENADIPIADTGLGNSSSNNTMDVYVDTAQKGRRSQAVSEGGEPFLFTDEDGNFLII